LIFFSGIITGVLLEKVKGLKKEVAKYSDPYSDEDINNTIGNMG